MSGLQLAWATGLILAIGLLPVGALRMVVYRSGETDHTRTHRFVAVLALALGGAGLLLCAAVTVWFLVHGERPVG